MCLLELEVCAICAYNIVMLHVDFLEVEGTNKWMFIVTHYTKLDDGSMFSIKLRFPTYI